MKIRTGLVSNSSSSSFICDTEMSIEEVREKLELLLNFHNAFNDREDYFDDMFDEPFIADEVYCSSDWAEYHSEIKKAKGKVIIGGSSDNSIPSEMFDLIEDRFDAYRCHFG